MRESMEIYPRTAAERAMKLQEVLLRASAGKIKWWQAAELIGISPRQLRRWRKRLEEQGHEGLLDRRRGIPSRRRVPKAKAEQVLSLYRDKYFDLNVRHFHEKLGEEHQIGLSYTWVKQAFHPTDEDLSVGTPALQAAGLVKRKAKRGVHRKRRERRPLPGMMLHIDGSHHQWFQDERWQDLIVILDDATSEIYYAQLAQEETTGAVMAGLRAVIEQKGLFCTLYSDRGAHFWLTPKSGGKVDYERPTQVGRAMKELGVQMIPSYSPQARGRSERNFSTWQGRLPQELRLRRIRTLEAANEFLNDHYIAEFNRRFTVPAAQRGTAFLPCPRRNLDLIFTQRFERTVDRDNTVSFHNLVMQIERAEWRPTMAGCKVIIHQHLDQTLTLTVAGHRIGHYSAEGKLLTPLTKKQVKAVEKTLRGKVTKQTFPLNLQIPQTTRDSHFPTASTTTDY
jgi:transposase-like protein